MDHGRFAMVVYVYVALIMDLIHTERRQAVVTRSMKAAFQRRSFS
jgi:hypothetical protein